MPKHSSRAMRALNVLFPPTPLLDYWLAILDGERCSSRESPDARQAHPRLLIGLVFHRYCTDGRFFLAYNHALCPTSPYSWAIVAHVRPVLFPKILLPLKRRVNSRNGTSCPSNTCAHESLIGYKLVKEVQAERKRILAWTVNDKNSMVRLAGWGVDGIISDDTRLVRILRPEALAQPVAS